MFLQRKENQKPLEQQREPNGKLNSPASPVANKTADVREYKQRLDKRLYYTIKTALGKSTLFNKGSIEQTYG